MKWNKISFKINKSFECRRLVMNAPGEHYEIIFISLIHTLLFYKTNPRLYFIDPLFAIPQRVVDLLHITQIKTTYVASPE